MTRDRERHYTEVNWADVLAAWSVCLSLFLVAALLAVVINTVAGNSEPLTARAQLAAETQAVDR